jgi:hypothetical protein
MKTTDMNFFIVTKPKWAVAHYGSFAKRVSALPKTFGVGE